MDISIPAVLILAFLVLQRVAELVWSRRNTTRLLAKGASEFGAEHYPIIVAVHVAWLASLVFFGLGQPVEPVWFVLFVLLQLARVWIIASLGERWTTRIIVLNEPLVSRGPFSWLKHPNYLLVIAEIFTVSMMFDLPTVAAVFATLNAAVLVVRIGAEEEALATLRQPTERETTSVE